MKIAFIDCLKCWGGGEKWHLEHAKHMHDVGHDVVVVARDGSPLSQKAKEKGLRTATFSWVNILNPIAWIKGKQFLSKEHFDVIVMNSSQDLKIFAVLGKYLGIPRIVFRRGSDIPIRNKWTNRKLYGNYITDILANSEATKRSINKNTPTLFPDERIKVIYNGINIPSPDSITRSTPEIPTIVTLGRMVPQKRHDLFIEIASILKSRGVSCRFVIGGDGPLMEEMRAKALSMGVGDMVRFDGFINNATEFLAQADIFALTSEWEGFGYVLAEAMTVSLPIVAFDTSSNGELVSDGDNGILIEWHDTEAFASAIEKLLNSQELRAQMGQKGRNIVESKFDFEKNKRLVEEYLTSK